MTTTTTTTTTIQYFPIIISSSTVVAMIKTIEEVAVAVVAWVGVGVEGILFSLLFLHIYHKVLVVLIY